MSCGKLRTQKANGIHNKISTFVSFCFRLAFVDVQELASRLSHWLYFESLISIKVRQKQSN